MFADRVADAYLAFLLGSVYSIARSLRLRIGLSTIMAPIVADDAVARVLVKYTRESERDNSATSAREDALLPATARERDPMLGMSAREDAALPLANGSPRRANRIEELLARDPSPCSMLARRRMVRHFNARLAAFCRENPSFRLVDITDGATDSSTGAVLPQFVCRDPVNIHPLYEPSASPFEATSLIVAALPLWAKALERAGFELAVPWPEALRQAESFGDLEAFHEDKALRLYGRAGAPRA